STLQVSVVKMAYRNVAVCGGAPECFIIANIQFMCYSTPVHAFLYPTSHIRACSIMINLYGSVCLLDTIRMLVERSVPVCAHLGLMPQSVNLLGGYKIQGRDQAMAANTVRQALAAQQAGAQLLVLECVPTELGELISSKLSIPVIGIG